jgi:hypothetical protein
VAPETIIGAVSLDLATDWFVPMLREVSKRQMEDYAVHVLEHEDLVSALLRTAAAEATNASSDTEESATVDADGTVLHANGSSKEADLPVDLLPEPPRPPLFHSTSVWDDVVQNVAADVSEHFFGAPPTITTTNGKKSSSRRSSSSSHSANVTPGWKIHAKAAQFERVLDERYGRLRPFVTQHPELEVFLRNVQRRYALGHFSPLRQTSPPISRSTSIVILFMMHRGGVQWLVLLLTFLFLVVGVQPWALVAVLAAGHSLLMRRKRRPVGPTMSPRIPAIPPYYYADNKKSGPTSTTSTQDKYELLNKPVGISIHDAPSASAVVDMSQYDVLLLGSGSPTLYAAALLTRAGRKVLVLSPESDASGCLTLLTSSKNNKYRDVPFDVTASNVANLSRQVPFLVPALSTSTDCQGGIRFAQVGGSEDGHAYEILAIPGMGVDRKSAHIPYVLRADGGFRAIMEDAATLLGDGWPDSDGAIGQSTVGAYGQACETMNASSGLFFLSRIVPEYISNLRKDSLYEECAKRPASGFLDKCFPLNAHTRSLMAGIGMRIENLKPSQASMAAHVSGICAAANGEGMHYPIGGPRALCRALANVVERGGGKIITDADLHDLLFDEDPTLKDRNVTKPNDGPPAPRCVGVQLSNGRQFRFDADRYTKPTKGRAIPAVISMKGFIDTFIRLLPENVRTKYKVPVGLPALAERRPVFKVLCAISGSAAELDLTGADYYRLPNASLATDVFDAAAGTVVCGEIGGPDDHEVSAPSDGASDAHDPLAATSKSPDDLDGTTARTNAPKSKQKGHRVKYHPGESWMHVSFPSAKDPSFVSRHGNVTTCVVTIEADNEFVTPFDTSPRLFVITMESVGTTQEKDRLLDKVTKDLLEIYPQLEGRIDCAEIRGPFRRGLSHTPVRFAAKGIRAETPYPHLFVGGSDLTVGDSFGSAAVGAWLVSNAVVGYNAIDHFLLQKNLTSDLAEFVEPPTIPDEEDVAVPYTVNSQPVSESPIES